MDDVDIVTHATVVHLCLFAVRANLINDISTINCKRISIYAPKNTITHNQIIFL